MERRGLTQLEVGRRLGHQRNGSVRGVIKGLRPLPLDALSDWERALDLSAEEARTFRRLALRSYAPPYVQVILDELDVAKDQAADLKRVLAEREADEPEEA